MKVSYKCRNCKNWDRPCCLHCDGDSLFENRRERISYVSYENMIKRNNSKHLDELIEKVIFNPPATIVLWKDGFPKTVVKCQEGDTYDREKGLAMCIAKRCNFNNGSYCDVFKKWCGTK